MAGHWLHAAVAAMALVAVTADAAVRRDPPHVPQPGYQCRVGKPFDGEVWGERSLDETGKQVSASMEWRAKDDVWQPRLTTLWTINGAAPLRAEGGAFFMSWSLKDEARKRRNALLALEMTTEARASPWPRALLVGKLDKSSGRGLEAAWSDVLALARGARELFAIFRDKRGAIVAQARIDPALFSQGGRLVADAQAELDAMSHDFRSRCAHVDDLNPDIVVT